MAADLVGHYRVVATLGSGGMGVVSKAIDTRLNRPVALKAIRDSSPENTDAVLRLRAEALAAASLDHPYICKIYELLETGAATIVVMEFVEGETLGDILDRRVPPLVDTLRYGSEIAEGLANAHARGIVHRDVKPSNVMVTPHGHIKLLDFGIARINNENALTQSGLTLPGNIPGTPQYMAPEQALGRPLDGRADLFSLGILLFRCLTGRLPFEGVTRDEYIQQMLAGRVRPLDELAPEAPASVRDVVKSCLHTDPALRPQSASVVADTLRRAAEALSTSTVPVASSARAGRMPGWVPPVLFVTLVGGALVFAVVRWRPTGSDSNETRSLVPAVTWPSSESGARVSPDGRLLSFVSDRQNQSRIFVQAIEGADPVAVSIQGAALSHAWSPDSREFAALVRQGQRHFLLVVPAFFGGSPRVSIPLDPGLADISVLRWIGDNVYLDVDRGNAGRSLLRASMSSRAVEDLSAKWPAELAYRRVDVSPDGRRVVVSSSASGASDLLTANIDGSGVQRLTRDDYADYSPLWIDAGTILFESNRGGQMDLWEIAVGTNRLRQLTSSQMREAATGASTDGSVVAFEQSHNPVTLWRLDHSSGALRQLTADALSDFWPSASATGNMIAFQRTRPTPVEGFQFFDSRILVAPLGDAALEPQTVADGFFARLSADGQWVAFYQRIPDRRHLRLVAKNLATGETRTLSDRCVLPALTANLLPVDFLEQNVVWSASGARLYYLVAEDGGQEVHSTDLGASSQRPARILSAGPNAQMWDLRLSPDDGTLAVAVRVRDEKGGRPRSEVRLHDSSGDRESAIITETADDWQLRVPGWTGNDTLMVLRSAARPEQLFELELFEMTIGGGRRLVGTVPDSVIPAVRLDPARGRLFLTRNIDGIHNVYMMSLSDGTQRQVTENHTPGVSFSGIQPLQDDAMVFARDERKRDIWLVTTGTRRQ